MKTNKTKRKNKDIVKQNTLDTPINPQEAQNVSDSGDAYPAKMQGRQETKPMKVSGRNEKAAKTQKYYRK